MIDEKDKLLLSLLRNDSRLTLKEMSKEIDMPISTVHDRLKKIEKKGIVRHTSLLDFQKVGAAIHTYITFTNPEDDPDFLEYLKTHPQTNSVFRVNQGFSYLLECAFSSMRELREFTDGLENLGIIDLREHHVIQEVKREGFLP